MRPAERQRAPTTKKAILLAQLAGNHARRAETPLTSSMPLWRREWGRLVTTTFTGPLGARSRFTSARELDETNKLHTEGIQSLGSPMTPLVFSDGCMDDFHYCES